MDQGVGLRDHIGQFQLQFYGCMVLYLMTRQLILEKTFNCVYWEAFPVKIDNFRLNGQIVRSDLRQPVIFQFNLR